MSFSENQNISYLGTKDALGLPVVEQSQEFIGIFKGVGSSSPVVINNSSYFLTYLVNSEGQVTKIADDSIALRDVNSNFLDNPNVIVRVDQPTQLNANLSGEHKVTSVGSLSPLLYTQTGSTAGANVNSLSFLPPGVDLIEGAQNFIGKIDRISKYIIPNFNYTGQKYYVRNYSDTEIEPDSDAAILNLGAGNTEVTGSYTLADPLPTPDVISSITIKGSTLIQSRGTLGLDLGEMAQFSLFLYQKRGDTHTLLDTAQGVIARPAGGAAALPGSPQNTDETYFSANLIVDKVLERSEFEAGDEFYLRLDRDGGNIFNVRMYYQSLEVKEQTPTSGEPYLFNDQNPKGYWETGSASVLTSSVYLGTQYGNIQQQLTASEDFGFPPIEDPFAAQVGDKIRFGYNANETYTVYKVIPPSSPLASGSRAYLVLNKEVPSNLNTNNFVLYRNKLNGKFVTLDVSKNEDENTEFTGIIIPRYPSQKLRDNIENIILQLKTDGIIEE